MRVRITVDPGQSCGVAVWDHRRWYRQRKPVETLLLTVTRQGDWRDRVELLCDKFDNVLKRLGPVNVAGVWCEMPAFMAGARGRAASSKQSITKLAFLTGALAATCWSKEIPFCPVPVVDWKGQLTKEMVNARVTEALNGAEFKRDVWDAVGLGLWLKGVL